MSVYNSLMVKLSHIALVKKYSKTYRLGLLQAHAFRILKQRTMRVLSPCDINTLDWAVLGMLNDVPKLTYKEVAKELAVTSPVVTTTCEKLLNKKLIHVSKDVDDARVKHIALTPAGKEFVEKQESIIRAGMKDVIAKASTRDLLGYIAVLQSIVSTEDLDGPEPYSWFEK